MSFSGNTLDTIFTSKKDKTYVQLKSHYNFLEAFCLSDIKCTGVRIPETILIESGGNVKNWIFTSKKDEDLPILKKKPEKLNTGEIFSYFNDGTAFGSSKSRTASEFFTTKLGRTKGNKEPKAIVRYINGALDLLDMIEFQDYLQTGLNYLKTIQVVINMKSKSDYNSSETYYCEYRQEDLLSNVSYRVIKKVSQFSNPEENISSSNYLSKVLFKGSINKSLNDHIQSHDQFAMTSINNAKDIKVSANLIKKNSQKFYRVFDIPTNEKLEKLTKQIALYLMHSFQIIIRKLICKFALSESNEFYFMGIKELYVDFKNKGIFEPGREVYFEEMVNTIKGHEREKEALLFISTEEKEKRKNTKILKEECQGDFCDFISLDSMKLIELALGHNVSQYIHVEDKKLQRKLPYEITYNLVRRCKQDALEIKEIFKQRRIFPKYYAELVNDSPQALNNVDFEIKFKKTDHDNLQNMYKFVKICKNCYPIYVTLQKTLLDAEIKKQPALNHFSRILTRVNPSVSRGKTSKSHIPSAVQSPSGHRSPTSSISGFRKGSMELHDYIEDKPIVEPKPMDNARKNLKRILSTSASKTFLAKPTQDVLYPKEMNRSVQTALHQQRQKFTSQRLNLGVSTYNKKFLGVLMSAEPQTQEEASNDMRRVMVRHKNLHVIHDSNSDTPKIISSSSLIGAFEENKRTDEEENAKRNEIHKKTLKRIASNVRRATILDPFREKKKGIVQGMSQISEEEKPLLPITTLLLIAKKLNMNAVLFELKQLLHKRKEASKGEKEVMSLHHHGVFDVARRIPPFTMTTPKTKMNSEFRMIEKPYLDINKLCDLGGYEVPAKYRDLIKIFIVDEHTAIPYAVISSDSEKYKSNDVIVVCHDLFGNLIEDIDYFSQFTEKAKNIQFILFNLPGQSYTLYKEEHIYNNDYNAVMIDMLLEALHKQDKFDPRIDLVKFIGVGYGANILLYYNNFADNEVFTKSYILAINPFIYVNDIMRQTLEKSKQIFLEVPQNMNEMPNLYCNLTFGNGRMTKEEAIYSSLSNQITPSGRITIINGIIQSNNLKNAISDISSSIIVINTLQNAITNNEHTYIICNNKNQLAKSSTKLKEFMTDSNKNRMVINSKGYYAAFEEREPEVLQVVEDFLIAAQDQNNLLDWILNEKMLVYAEQEIFNLEELELEEANSYIEKLSDMKKVSKEIQASFLSEVEEFIGVLILKIKEVEHKVFRSEENLNLLKITSMEKVQNKEMIPGAIEKIKKSHEEKLIKIKEHIQTIYNQKQEPLNLLFMIAKNLHSLEELSSVVSKASNAKILNQHQNELVSTMANQLWDYGKIYEFVVMKMSLFFVFKDVMKKLIEISSNISTIEIRYKAIPPIPLFDHNMQGLKTKGTEVEVHEIQLRSKLAFLTDFILQSFYQTKLENEESIERVDDALQCYHSEFIGLMELLKPEGPKFVKLKANLNDPNYINSPSFLYSLSQTEMENYFTTIILEKRTEEFNRKIEENLVQKGLGEKEEIIKRNWKELKQKIIEIKNSL